MTRGRVRRDIYVRGKRGMVPSEDYIIFNFSMRATRLNPAITSNWSRLANIPRSDYVRGSFQIETNSPERTAHYQDRTSILLIDNRSIGYNVVRGGNSRELTARAPTATSSFYHRSGMSGISCIVPSKYDTIEIHEF